MDSKSKLNEIEREEGEIVEDLDYLSDISSEEEFLLRQRLEVLENYNNVLERKKAKRSSIGSGHSHQKPMPLPDLSDISASEIEDHYSTTKRQVLKEPKQKVKPHRKLRKYKENNSVVHRTKDVKKNQHSRKKKQARVVLETSDDSDDDYRFKRRKLSDAVAVRKEKNEKTSLSSRLKEMLQKAVNREPYQSSIEDKKVDIVINNEIVSHDLTSPINPSTEGQVSKFQIEVKPKVLNLDNSLVVINSTEEETNTQDSVKDLDDKTIIQIETVENTDTVDSIDCQKIESEQKCSKDSDDDLETLRQAALTTKLLKTSNVKTVEVTNKVPSDDEDSDTTELRLICLKSTLLKKAIEMKQKQKRKKKLSQSSYRHDELIDSLYDDLSNRDSGNNTDKESVDMELASDETDEKRQNPRIEIFDSQNFNKMPLADVPKQDEFEEDEDLLRAKLLTSLSKNLPNLVNTELINVPEPPNRNSSTEISVNKQNEKSGNKKENVPEEKKFIIKLGSSDSEGENEATKNLTKMHLKLEEISFATKLDRLLKSTRMQVEKNKDVETVSLAPVPKEPKKFVAKALNNLPESEQIEYRNLVRRMAELEKLKQTRQLAMNYANRLKINETLRPKNKVFNSDRIVTVSNLEEQIARSRKKIAEESSKMMKLKEEAVKLSQKYKIAATELRNISTAIHINKKHQRTVQNSLTKIRNEHQRLIKNAPVMNKQQLSKINTVTVKKINKPPTPKVLKENNPSESRKNATTNKNTANSIEKHEVVKTPMLSIQVDVSSNRKVVKLPPKSTKSPTKVDPIDLPPTNPIKPKNPTSDGLSESLRDRLGPKSTDSDKTSPNDGPTENSVNKCDKNEVIEPEVKLSRTEKYERLLGEYISPLDSLSSTTSSESYANKNSRPMPIKCYFFGFYKSNVDGKMRTHRHSSPRFGGLIRTRSSVLSRSAEIARTPNANSYTSTLSHNDTAHSCTTHYTSNFTHIIHYSISIPYPFPFDRKRILPVKLCVKYIHHLFLLFVFVNILLLFV